MKEKIKAFFGRISPILDKIGTNKYLQSIMGAMMAILGPIILGSFATLIGVWAGNEKWKNVQTIAGNVGNVTINLAALYVVFLVAKYLVKNFLKNDDGTSAGVISLMCFLIMTPLGQIKGQIKKGKNMIPVIPTTWLSSQGLFSAIIIGMLVGRFYVYIKQRGWTIKMPAGVPSMVSDAFASLIPALIMGIIAAIISYGFMLTSWGSFHQMVYSIIQVPLRHLGGSIN